MKLLSLTWEWLKKYWQVGLVVAAVSLVIIFKMQAAAQVERAMKEIEAVEERHKKELTKINDAHDVQVKEREANLKALEMKLADIEKVYDEARKKLDDAKRIEIKKIVEEHHDDPAELAKQLSEATGIPIGP